MTLPCVENGGIDVFWRQFKTSDEKDGRECESKSSLGLTPKPLILQQHGDIIARHEGHEATACRQKYGTSLQVPVLSQPIMQTCGQY